MQDGVLHGVMSKEDSDQNAHVCSLITVFPIPINNLGSIRT